MPWVQGKAKPRIWASGKYLPGAEKYLPEAGKHCPAGMLITLGRGGAGCAGGGRGNRIRGRLMVILRKSWPRQPNPGTTHGNSYEILAILVSWRWEDAGWVGAGGMPDPPSPRCDIECYEHLCAAFLNAVHDYFESVQSKFKRSTSRRST